MPCSLQCVRGGTVTDVPSATFSNRNYTIKIVIEATGNLYLGTDWPTQNACAFSESESDWWLECVAITGSDSELQASTSTNLNGSIVEIPSKNINASGIHGD